MTEQQNPVLAPEAPSAPKPKKRKQNKKRLKTILALVITLAVLAGLGYLLWYFVLKPAPVDQGDIYSQPAYIGSIQSTVQGSGNAKAKESAASL